MAYSTQRATSDGTMVLLNVSIGYLKRADIGVFFNGLPAPGGTWSWVGTTDTKIAFSPALAVGTQVLLKRTTQINTMINIFALGASFNNSSMDKDFLQLLYLNQEAVEGAALTDIFNDVDFHGFRIKNIGTAVLATDAVSLGQYQADALGAGVARDQAVTAKNTAVAAVGTLDATAAAALASKNLAADWAAKLVTTVDGTSYSAKYYAAQTLTYRDAAATSATNAGVSETNALASKNAAATSATNAATSATNAATSAASVTSTNFIAQTSGLTGAANISVGTTAQRPAGAAGYFRYNSDLLSFEGYAGGAWGSVGGGARGAVGNAVFYENDTDVTGDYSITSGKNAMSAGPITIDTGKTVTVPSGSTWTIV